MVGGHRHDPAALPQEKDPVPIVQGTGWAKGHVWTSAKNLAMAPGFDPQSVSARSESLY